jgi:hypothetical protein
MPPAAPGPGALAAKPGPQRRAGQRHRRADQRPRILARLKGQLEAEQVAVLDGLGWRRTNDALGPVVRAPDGRVVTLGTRPGTCR